MHPKAINCIVFYHCTVASKQEGLGFNSGLQGQGVSVRNLHVLSVPKWVLSRYFDFLPQSKYAKPGVILFGHSTLPLVVDVSADSCLSLYDTLRRTGNLSKAYPTISPKDAEIGSSSPATANRISGRKWIVFFIWGRKCAVIFNVKILQSWQKGSFHLHTGIICIQAFQASGLRPKVKPF